MQQWTTPPEEIQTNQHIHLTGQTHASAFKLIHPAAPSAASGTATQETFNTLLDMLDSTQEMGSSPDGHTVHTEFTNN